MFVCCMVRKVRKLQSQRPSAGRGGVDGTGLARVPGGDARDPSVKDAKKAELSAWLASEIEVPLMCCTRTSTRLTKPTKL